LDSTVRRILAQRSGVHDTSIGSWKKFEPCVDDTAGVPPTPAKPPIVMTVEDVRTRVYPAPTVTVGK